MTRPLIQKGLTQAQHFFPPWLVLSLALATTIWVWQANVQQIRANARLHFEADIAAIEQTITDRFNIYENTLRGVLAFVLASREVERSEWQTYVETSAITSRHPGIQGIGYAVRVDGADLASHVRTVRQLENPTYDVYPSGDRAQYFPILFLEPGNARNQRALGFDMYSNPARRAAMERARDTGKASMSGVVTLVQETADDKQSGFLVYLPHYRSLASIATVADRRNSLAGFVYSPFRMGDLMQGIWGNNPPSLRFRVYDGDRVNEAHFMYDSHPSFPQTNKNSLSDTRTVERAGRLWTIQYQTTSQFRAENDLDDNALEVLVTGIVFSVLLFGITLSIANTRTRAV
ncbi:MAG TPA: CHASE domain-containing protein, partial [Burkholderiales bacterium]|nr:CHASE domain-containing protein [Burkholderiales bacterium]